MTTLRSKAAAKKDRLEYVKSHRKESEICHFNLSASQNPLRWPIKEVDIFEDFEPPSNKFRAMPQLLLVFMCCKCWICYGE